MKLWVGVTDKSWFEHLTLLKPDEVNFWKPSGELNFHVLGPGESFLFKLHSPDNFIVGGGFFGRYSPLPASLAWDAFGQKNGVASLPELRARVQKYRRSNESLDPVIGCNVLAEPFFLPRSEWVPIPPSWSANIVQGKTYDTETTEGAALWASVATAAKAGHRVDDVGLAAAASDEQRQRLRIPHARAVGAGRVPRARDRCLSTPLRHHGG